MHSHDAIDAFFFSLAVFFLVLVSLQATQHDIVTFSLVWVISTGKRRYFCDFAPRIELDQCYALYFHSHSHFSTDGVSILFFRSRFTRRGSTVSVKFSTVEEFTKNRKHSRGSTSEIERWSSLVVKNSRRKVVYLFLRDDIFPSKLTVFSWRRRVYDSHGPKISPENRWRSKDIFGHRIWTPCEKEYFSFTLYCSFYGRVFVLQIAILQEFLTSKRYSIMDTLEYASKKLDIFRRDF